MTSVSGRTMGGSICSHRDPLSQERGDPSRRHGFAEHAHVERPRHESCYPFGTAESPPDKGKPRVIGGRKATGPGLSGMAGLPKKESSDGTGFFPFAKEGISWFRTQRGSPNVS